MMMKKALLPAVLFIVTFPVLAQAPFPRPEEIKQFDASKTCVVLDDNQLSAYNAIIKKAVQAYWNVTPFEFITQGEFDSRRKDPKYSFIILTQTSFDNDKSKSQFNYINLLQGKNIELIGQMPEICAVPLSSADEDDIDYGYKMGAILQFMQHHAKMISADPSLTGRKYLKYYNKNIPLISGKIILVMKQDLAPEADSPEKIAALNKNIKIVGEDDIVTAVRSKAANTLILHEVGPGSDRKSGYCFKMLIGTDDSEMYFYNQRKIDDDNPYGLLLSDIKKFSK
jgi:hypothetical protein